jgi:hypothetical protein
MKKINQRTLEEITTKHLGKNFYKAMEIMNVYSKQRIAEQEAIANKKKAVRASRKAMWDGVRASVNDQMSKIGIPNA